MLKRDRPQLGRNSGVSVKVVESGYRELPEPLEVTTRAAKAATALRFRMPASRSAFTGSPAAVSVSS